MIRVDELATLYIDIRDCHVCADMDREKALRLVQAVNTESDVFIISQALAASQLRKSGVNFFQPDGHLGSTGKSLERFLNCFRRTVYPQQDVTLPSGATIPRCNPGYVTVYNTEIAQCYPGRNARGTGDRAPTHQELETCVGRGFLMREVELIKPRLLLLMGKTSRDAFFDYVLKEHHPGSLTEHIRDLSNHGELPRFTLGDCSSAVLPIQHASGANPRFHSMLCDEDLAQLVKEVLYG